MIRVSGSPCEDCRLKDQGRAKESFELPRNVFRPFYAPCNLPRCIRERLPPHDRVHIYKHMSHKIAQKTPRRQRRSAFRENVHDYLKPCLFSGSLPHR